jgi:hypothetical protein
MTESTDARKKDIVRFDLGLDETWHPVPLDADGTDSWAAELTASFGLQSPAADLLSFQLNRLRLNLQGIGDPTVTSVVWIPQPESGYVACALSFKLSPLQPTDSLDAVLADLEADRTRSTDEHQFLEVDVWRGRVAAGPFVAARNLIVNRAPGELEGSVEERTVFAVMPDSACQMVQFVFSAESIGAFYDIAGQTQAVVETLRVELGDPR